MESTPAYNAADFFELQLEQATGSHASNIRWFVNSYREFVGDKSPLLSEIDKAHVDSYRRHIIAAGLKSTTIVRYMQTFRAMFNRAVKQKIVPPADAFKEIGSSKGEASCKGRNIFEDESALEVIRKINSLQLQDESVFSRAREALSNHIFSITSTLSIDIDANLLHNLEGLLYMIGKNVKADQTFPDMFKSQLLLEAKVDPGIVKALCRKLPPDSPLNLLPASEITEEEKVETLRRVKELINDEREAWYAARLYRMDAERIDDFLRGLESKSSYYYPYQTIMERGKKYRRENRPGILRNMVFIRGDRKKIVNIARDNAGYLSFYTNPGKAEESYAIVPEKEIARLRIMLGSLYEGVDFLESAYDEEYGWPEETMVAITGGPLKGYEGKIVSIGGTRRIMTLRFTTETGIRVTADIPDIFLRPL